MFVNTIESVRTVTREEKRGSVYWIWSAVSESSTIHLCWIVQFYSRILCKRIVGSCRKKNRHTHICRDTQTHSNISAKCLTLWKKVWALVNATGKKPIVKRIAEKKRKNSAKISPNRIYWAQWAPKNYYDWMRYGIQIKSNK